MTTLKQLLDERDVDTELAIHAVIEWLQQKPQEFRDFMTISKDEYDLIEEFVRKLLEELK